MYSFGLEAACVGFRDFRVRSGKQVNNEATICKDSRRETLAPASAGRQRAAGGGRTEKQTPLNKRGSSPRSHREPESSS